MLNGYSTEFKTEKSFQETDRLGVVCHHLGYDTYPRGFVRGAQKWGKILFRAFLRANSVLRHANGFGMPKLDGESSLIFQLRPIFTPKKSCSFSYEMHLLISDYCLNTVKKLNKGPRRICF